MNGPNAAPYERRDLQLNWYLPSLDLCFEHDPELMQYMDDAQHNWPVPPEMDDAADGV